MNNDQKIIDLLKSRALVQRRLRGVLDDLQAVTDEIENELARIESRKPEKKIVVVQIKNASGHD